MPQFIDVEDKIFGPLTFKQFVYLAGGGGLSVVLFVFLPKIVAILFIAPVAALAVALAFYKVNEKPFIFFMEAALRYMVTKKLYVWKKEPKKPVTEHVDVSTAPLDVPRLSDSRLRDLAWSLDIHHSTD